MMTDHATQSNWTINLKTMDVDDDDDDAWEESDDDDDTDDRNDDDTYDDRDDDWHGVADVTVKQSNWQNWLCARGAPHSSICRQRVKPKFILSSTKLPSNANTNTNTIENTNEKKCAQIQTHKQTQIHDVYKSAVKGQ